MPNGSRIDEDFIIVPTFVALVSKEMNLVVIFLNEFQTERFVPAFRENVERYLATDAIPKSVVSELFLQNFDQCFSNVMLVIVLFEGISLVTGTRSSNRRNIYHARTFLNVVGRLYWNFKLMNVVKTEVHQFIESIFA